MKSLLFSRDNIIVVIINAIICRYFVGCLCRDTLPNVVYVCVCAPLLLAMTPSLIGGRCGATLRLLKTQLSCLIMPFKCIMKLGWRWHGSKTMHFLRFDLFRWSRDCHTHGARQAQVRASIATSSGGDDATSNHRSVLVKINNNPVSVRASNWDAKRFGVGRR